MGRPRPVAVGTHGRDQGTDDDDAGVGEQCGHLRGAADVLCPVLGREPEVGVESVAQVVAVENVGGAPGFDEQSLDLGGDGGLARAGQAGQPQRAALPTVTTLDRAGVPDHVGTAGGGADDHAGAHGVAGELVHHDERTRVAVTAVGVVHQRGLRAQADPADLVELELGRLRVPVQRVDVEPVLHARHHGLGVAGGVLDDVTLAGGQACVVGEPADHGLELGALVRAVAGAREHLAADDVDLVVQRDRHGGGRGGLVELLPAGAPDRLDRRLPTGRHDHHVVVDLDDAAGDGARERAVIQSVGALGADHVLHREADVGEVAVRGDVDVLKVVEQRRARVPGHGVGALDDVVAPQRRQRHEGDVVDLELGGEVSELGADGLEGGLVVVDQVHLVDGHDQPRDTEQSGQEGVATGLLENTLARVDEDDRHVSCRGAGDHVARVLHVPRGVGDDELAPRGREVAVRDVDRDALLTLGAQPVGEQCEVGVLVAAPCGGGLDGGELVLEDALRVEQQSADQRGLAVVDGAGGRDAQQLRLLRHGVPLGQRRLPGGVVGGGIGGGGAHQK